MLDFTLFKRLLISGGVMLLLAACSGSEGGSSPQPTLINVNDLATRDAQTRLSSTATPTRYLTATSAALPPPPLTLTPVSLTPAPTQTVTLAPSATEAAIVAAVATTLAPEQPPIDEIAQTNTAQAAVLPFTETAVAVIQITQTALVLNPPTPSLTPTIPPPTSTQPDMFQVVYYSDLNGNDDIYLTTLNGVQRRLIASSASERDPSCAPDSRSVVYASDASGSYQIYLLRFDDPTPVQLTNSEGLNFAPNFSPDGTQIAFVSTRNQGIPTIWLMNADGTDQRQITTDYGRDTSPSWGPDGRQVLFSSEQFGPWNLFLTVLEEEVEGEFPVLPPEYSERNQLWPFFDPLGEQIVYTVWDNLEDPQTADIYLLDFEESEPRPVRAGAGADIAWGWGDSAHLLASVGGPGDVQIALVDVETGDVLPLTDSGSFNGGARLCVVPPDALPVEPEPPAPPAATLTPTITPTVTPTSEPTPVVFSPELLSTAGHPHIVQPGDTLMSIGYRYGVNWAALAALNNLVNPDILSVGQQLTVPLLRYAPSMRGGFREPDSDRVLVTGMRKEIVVDLSDQKTFAYENGRVIRTVTVSTGLPGTPTVLGEYSIYVKRDAQLMSGPGYYLPDVPWVMYFYQGYGLHGTYWHNNFGTPMSHGCVNLPTDEARWFYDWAEIGTAVLVRE
ncbi:MAG: PD40 domain-containing protein [Chloroflexi bacterium]|nr:PD40 domain-containing protein [Chloroflexota bacterium]